MADAPPPDPTQPPVLPDLAKAIITQFLEPAVTSKTGKLIEQVVVDVAKQVIGLLLYGAGEAGGLIAESLAAGEDEAGPAFTKLTSVAIGDMFGVNVTASAGRGGRASRTEAANAIGDMLLRAFSGAAAGSSTPSGELQPSDAPAKAFLSTMAQMSLEGWLEGWLTELLSLGQIERFGDLDDKISNTLGLGRAASSVHGPLIQHMIRTPLDWLVSKSVRPTLLSASVAIKAFRQGKWTRAELDEELARQGFAPRRIEALILENRHELSESLLTEMISSGLFDPEAAIPYLKKLGYSDEDAAVWGNADKFRRERKYRDDIIPIAIRAYANREIDAPELQQALDYALPNTEENNAARAHAEYARSFNVKHMSHAEIREAVERNILAMPDYRDWLRREGYPDDEALVLELLLESTLRGQQEAAKKRTEVELARAAAKAAADAERKRKAAELAAKKSRTFAPLGDIERAVVLGILPIGAFVAELERQKFSGDDIGFEVELLQRRRDDYLVALEKKKAAEGPPTPKTIALGKLERAVVLGRESVETYRARLTADNYAADDADVMVQLVTAARADRERADHAREAAAAALATRGLSLAQLDKAARQNLLSLDDYAGKLEHLGFPPEAVALLRASLAQDIQHAADAAAVRDAANAAAAAKGIGLAPLERAVKLGVRTRADYQQKLLDLAIAPEDQVTLLGTLDAELAELAAARAAREAPPPAPPPRGVTRADLEQAVREGVTPIGTYREYLVDAGYDVDAIDLLVALLTLEVQEARTRE